MPRLTLLAGLLLCSGLLHAAPTVRQLQDGLEHPWSLAFLPAEQGLLITERPGRLRLWLQGKGLSPPIAGVPQVYAEG
ncbi:PQQ-dependent sugar dehydrogenase, partial [Serratia marcescens]